MVNDAIANIQLTSLFVETAFYGFYLATFLKCLQALLTEHGRLKSLASISWFMLTIALLLFVVCSFDVALLFRHNLEAFIFYKGPGGAKEDFLQLTSWINVGKAAALGFVTVIGDVALIYRCYIVWGRSWKVICLSIVIEIVVAFSAAAVPYLEATSTGEGLVVAHRLNVWTTTFVVVTFVMQTLTTGLICYKMWTVSANAKAYASPGPTEGSPIQFAMNIFIESGLLMAIGFLFMMGTSFAKSPIIYPVSDAMAPVTGIAFNIIIVRVAGRREGSSTTLQPPFPLNIITSPIDNPLRSNPTNSVVIDVTRSIHFDKPDSTWSTRI